MAESQAVRISDSKICAAKRVLKKNVVKGGKWEVEYELYLVQPPGIKFQSTVS